MKIGNIEVAHGLFVAPLAGVSDYTFRALARRFGAEYTTSEMVSAKALCFEQACRKSVEEHPSQTARLAAVRPEEYPMAVQLFGSEPEYLARAAQMLESGEYRGARDTEKPAAIDINMGCPMQKIVSNGEGAALLRDPVRAEAVVRAVVEAVKLPVTVKIRAGWDASSINAVEVAKRLESAGAAMICVHGRTRMQMYAPGADWTIIGKVKEALRIPVVGNGDVFCAEDALRMLRETGCDGVMIARGAQGNPWIFREIRCALEGEAYTPPTPEERLSIALEHANELVRLRGERQGIPEARKHMAWYLTGTRGAAAARDEVMHADTVEDLKGIFDRLLAKAD